MKKILVFAALAALLLLSLSGCSNDVHPTLTYYVDGDVYHTDVLETEDEIFAAIGKEPIKHGCLFGGWYYDEGVWEKPLSYVELNKTAENKEYKVYAKWETVKLEYVEADRSYTVVGLLLGAGETVVIPETYKDLPITRIAAEAFRGNATLTSVIIPDTVTSIGEYAFAECTALESVSLPNSVTTLGRGAFSNCVSLSSLKLSTALKSLEAETFYRCQLLTEVSVPTSVTSIGGRAFAGATALGTVSLPSRLSSISGEVFSGCAVTTVSYAGKRADWEKIAKEDFAKGSSISSIRCVDGTLTLSE